MNSVLNSTLKTISTSESKSGKKYKKSAYATLCVWAVLLLLTSFANATHHVEGFEYPKPDSNSFSYDIFQHNIVPQPDLDYVVWNISTFGSPPSGKALDLWPAVDEITFDLAPGEYVDYVAFDFIDWGGSTIVEVTIDSDIFPIEAYLSEVWMYVELIAPQEEITMLRLSSYEGAFDNITVNVVPEPATILLLTLGGIALRKRNKA